MDLIFTRFTPPVTLQDCVTEKSSEPQRVQNCGVFTSSQPRVYHIVSRPSTRSLHATIRISISKSAAKHLFYRSYLGIAFRPWRGSLHLTVWPSAECGESRLRFSLSRRLLPQMPWSLLLTCSGARTSVPII